MIFKSGQKVTWNGHKGEILRSFGRTSLVRFEEQIVNQMFFESFRKALQKSKGILLSKSDIGFVDEIASKSLRIT